VVPERRGDWLAAVLDISIDTDKTIHSAFAQNRHMQSSHGQGCCLYSNREELVARVLQFVYIVKKDGKT
jgi:hypothetical protein